MRGIKSPLLCAFGDCTSVNGFENMARFMPDLTLPGYRYLGPFNDLSKGPPRGRSDAAALEHDIAYEQYLADGLNPYFNYNEADDKFLKKISEESDYGGRIATGLFSLKKRFFPRFVQTPNKVLIVILKIVIFYFLICFWFSINR